MFVCPYVMVLLTEHKVVNRAGQAYPLQVLLSFFARSDFVYFFFTYAEITYPYGPMHT